MTPFILVGPWNPLASPPLDMSAAAESRWGRLDHRSDAVQRQVEETARVGHEWTDSTATKAPVNISAAKTRT